MTPEEFRATLKRLGLRQRWLSERLGVETSTVNRWATGKAPVPQYAVFALSLIKRLTDEQQQNLLENPRLPGSADLGPRLALRRPRLPSRPTP